MASQTRPEPMNASPHHSKVKVSLTLSDPLYVAGNHISGKMEMECRADKGLGIGVMMVELFAIQELTSRDHSATSTFLHSRRFFQGPGLPPSNAVLPFPNPGDPPLPSNYYQARRGLTTFLFRFPTPSSSPSAINFGSGLARVRYEVRASVGVAWKGDKRLVTDKREVDVVESFEEDFGRLDPEGVVVGENGKVWMQAKVVGGIIVAGESACVELQVKNHSSKKSTGLGITLTRSLHLPNVPATEKQPLQISDSLTTVAFRGQEYIVPPGTEGVANLVFDIPKNARGVKGGPREGAEEEVPTTECLFEVRCILGIKMSMSGLTSKDIQLDLPVTITHPAAVPEPSDSPMVSPPINPYGGPTVASPPLPATSPVPYSNRPTSPYAYPLPMSPPIPFADQNRVWLPPPMAGTPNPYQYFSPPLAGQQYYFPPPPTGSPAFIPRPSSAEPSPSQDIRPVRSGLPSPPTHTRQLPPMPMAMDIGTRSPVDPEKGKGERASRIALHLRMSSRNRSVSPQSHRFPLPLPQPGPSQTTVLHQDVPSDILSTSPTASQAPLHSPRPILTPRHSFSVDPVTKNSLPKSDRVEELERMADEVAKQSKDLSGDIPMAAAITGTEKTLPSPPVPSGKFVSSSPRPRADNVFASAAVSDSHSANPDPITPPTPPLAAITPVRFPRGDLLAPLSSESGLDALERRLLADVGTRKLDKEDTHRDVRSVLPITIPTPKLARDPLNDSAISSLTLANHEHDHEQGSDAHTDHPGKASRSAENGEKVLAALLDLERGRDPGAKKSSGSSTGKTAKRRDGERREKKKKKERTADQEVNKLRDAAKGRVADWLGRIEPEAPPVVDEPPSSPASIHGDERPDSPPVTTVAASDDHSSAPPANDPVDKEVSAPNPRSSGFVPIATLKQRQAETKENAIVRRWAPTFVPRTKPENERTFWPPPPQPKPDHHLPRAAAKSHDAAARTDLPLAQKNAQPSPRLPKYPPPPVDSEVKYDIRSARGGRGGKVTAVASIWASGAIGSNNAKSDATPKSPPLHAPAPNNPLKTFGKSPLSPPVKSSPSTASTTPVSSAPEPQVKHARLIKSTSVPAVISSSHATPTLSTTASLARPSPPLNKNRIPTKLPPTIMELPADSPDTTHSAAKTATPKSPPADLAFGQARLRDLIKKYQGQAS